MASVVQDPRQAIGPEKEAPRAPAAAPQGFNPGGFPPKQAGEKDRHCLLRPCAIGRDSCKTTNLSGYNVSRFVDVLPVKQRWNGVATKHPPRMARQVLSICRPLGMPH